MRLSRLLKAYCLLLLVTLRLRLLRSAFFFHAVDAIPRPMPCLTSDEELMVIEETQRSLEQAEKWMPIRISCLPRTLVLQQLLWSHGVATRLQIGVKKSGTTLKAHAWLEYQDAILHDSAAHCNQYQPLQTLSSEAIHPK
jgi:hypothetical protein